MALLQPPLNMGSKGTGSLTDYSRSRTTSAGAGGGRGGRSGGSSGEDVCNKAISATLEEVDRCPFYQQQKALPPNGAAIDIQSGQRLGAYSGSVLVGYLPTTYNYLAACIKSGRTYKGLVVSSTTVPVNRVTVDIAPV